MIVVPFVEGMLTEATWLAVMLEESVPAMIRMEDDGAYWRMLSGLFTMGEPFVVVEQDVVPWPGAIAALEACKEPWCAHSYSPIEDLRTGCAPLGCSKFRPEALPTELLRNPPNGGHWGNLDCWITQTFRSAGLEVCQHRPGVQNLNPARLGVHPI